MTPGFVFDDDEESVLVSVLDDRNEDKVSADKTPGISTAKLASQVAKEMKQMEELMAKLKTGTATRQEIKEMKSLSGKLSMFKKEAEVAEHDEVFELRSTVATKTAELHRAIKKKEIRSAIEAVCAAERVDLAFLLDSTGSMGSYIEGVKKNIKAIVANIKTTNGNLRLRLAMVAYRDVSDRHRSEVFPFSESVLEFESFVENLRATGGGDAPEDIAGAVQKVNELDWTHPTRLTFLITDAPCHGVDFSHPWERGRFLSVWNTWHRHFVRAPFVVVPTQLGRNHDTCIWTNYRLHQQDDPRV
jgi:hypothetical protein